MMSGDVFSSLAAGFPQPDRTYPVCELSQQQASAELSDRKEHLSFVVGSLREEEFVLFFPEGVGRFGLHLMAASRPGRPQLVESRSSSGPVF